MSPSSPTLATLAMQINRGDIQNFLTIRHVMPVDDKSIAALLLKSFLETNSKKMSHVKYNEKWIFELFDVRARREAGVEVVIEMGREIFATCARIPPGCLEGTEWTLNTAYLRALAVDPEYHGLGLSRLMLLESIHLARSWNADHVALPIQSGAEGVARVYKDFGFL